MDLLVFAVIVILVAILAIVLCDALVSALKAQPPVGLVLRVLILLVAIIAIAQRGGAF